MSGEIEFLGPEPEPGPPRTRVRATGRPGIGAVAAVLGWGAAAALAVFASFEPLYQYDLPPRFADYLPLQPQGVDGWGRGPGSGPLFGIALTACGAVLALLAVAGITSRSRRLVAGGAIGAPCLLTGVVAMLGLYAFSVVHSTPAGVGATSYAPLHAGSGSAFAFTAPDFVALGPGLWLACGALACAVVGSAGYLAAQRSTRRLAG